MFVILYPEDLSVCAKKKKNPSIWDFTPFAASEIENHLGNDDVVIYRTGDKTVILKSQGDK